MQLILVFSASLIKVCLAYLLKVVKVVGALGIDAFMYDEVIAVFFVFQQSAAIRASEVKKRKAVAFFRENRALQTLQRNCPFDPLFL